MDNTAYMVAPNTGSLIMPGEDSAAPTYVGGALGGRSGIYDYKGQVLTESSLQDDVGHRGGFDHTQELFKLGSAHTITSVPSSILHGVLHPTVPRGQRQRRIEVVQEDAFLSDAVVVEGGTVDGARIRGVLSGAASRAIELYFDISDALIARPLSKKWSTSLGDRYLQSEQVH